MHMYGWGRKWKRKKRILHEVENDFPFKMKHEKYARNNMKPNVSFYTCVIRGKNYFFCFFSLLYYSVLFDIKINKCLYRNSLKWVEILINDLKYILTKEFLISSFITNVFWEIIAF